MVSDCNVRRISGLNSDEHVQDHARDKSACTQKEYAVPQFGCKSYACAIQDCLAKYSYNQAMCEREIQTLVDCCAQLPAPQGSVHCAGFMPRVRKAKEKLEKQQQEEHYKPSFPAERT